MVPLECNYDMLSLQQLFSKSQLKLGRWWVIASHNIMQLWLNACVLADHGSMKSISVNEARWACSRCQLLKCSQPTPGKVCFLWSVQRHSHVLLLVLSCWKFNVLSMLYRCYIEIQRWLLKCNGKWLMIITQVITKCRFTPHHNLKAYIPDNVYFM